MVVEGNFPTIHTVSVWPSFYQHCLQSDLNLRSIKKRNKTMKAKSKILTAETFTFA